MSLATYEEARPWAKAIKEEVLRKRMPPWPAVKGFGDFSNAPALSQREVDLLVNWVEGGAPKGDDKDVPAEPLFSNDWALGKPDLRLSPDSDYAVKRDADEHRTFTFEANAEADRWLRAIDLKPGNGAVVHCATISVEAPPSVEMRPAAPIVLAKWMPGQQAKSLPEPYAYMLPAGSRIIVDLHYRNTGEQATDKTEIGLYFSRAASHRAIQQLAFDVEDTIPAGAPRHRTMASLSISKSTDAVGIRPATNALITSIQATAYFPNGSQQVLVWTRASQFDWEPTYYFKRPITLPRGTRVEVITYFDNSDANRNNPNDPPKAVKLSDLSTEALMTLIGATRNSND